MILSNLIASILETHMRIHIIRHAESVANKETILAGQLEYPLTEKGMKDASAIAERYVKEFLPEKIYCSTLLRARQTAEPFRNLLSVPFELDARLAEHNLGIYQNRTYAEAEADPLYETDRTKRWLWKPENGETYKDIAERLSSFLTELGTGDGFCLLVSHGAAMRILRGLLEATLPVYPERIPHNGEVWELDFKGIGKKHEIRSLFFDGLNYSKHRA